MSMTEGCDEAIKVKFRANGLMEEMERIRVAIVRKASEVSEAASRVIDAAMLAVGARGRGPDPDAAYPPPQRDTDRILEGLFSELAELRRRPSNFGGVDNSGGGGNRVQLVMFVIGVLVTINIGITGAVSTWVVNNIERQASVQADQGKDIAVIKCKIDPQCRVVVSSDKP